MSVTVYAPGISVEVIDRPVVIPPAPPPPVDKLIPLLPSGMFHSPPPQTRKYDFVRQSKMGEREVKWNVPMAAPGVFANSMQGKKPTRIMDYHLWGARTFLYSQVQAIINGRSDPFNSEFGDDLNQIAGWQKKYPRKFGRRGICRPDGYCSVISHPFLDLAGNYNANLPFIIAAWHDREMGGGYSDGSFVSWGKVPGTKPFYQVCDDKQDRTYMYAAELNGNIVKIDRTKGKAGSGKTEDATLYDVTTAWAARAPTSVSAHTDGTVYYVDQGDIYKNGVLWQRDGSIFALVVDPPRNRVVAVFGSWDKFGFVAYDFSGSVLFTTTLQTGVASNPLPVAPSDFFTVDVDENATCGPGGTISVTRVHTIGNVNLWEISPDGTQAKYGQAITPSMQGWNVCGNVRDVHEWYGHYNWLHHYHRFQACRIKWGYGDTILSVAVCDPPLPASGVLPYVLVWSGMSALAEAGLTSVVSSQGESPYLGCSYDELAELSFDDCYAAIQAGLITETPRPELAGIPGIRAVGAICANSQRAMREGKPFLDAYLSWASAKGLGTNYGSVLNVGHFTAQYPTYYETDGNTIVATDQGRSTPIRYAWPPANPVSVSTAGQSIVNDNGVVYCTPGPTRARVA